MMLLNNGIGLLPTLALALLTGEHRNWHALGSASGRDLAYLAASCVNGLAISYAGIRLQHKIAATSFMVVTNVSKFAVIFFGVAVLGESVRAAPSDEPRAVVSDRDSRALHNPPSPAARARARSRRSSAPRSPSWEGCCTPTRASGPTRCPCSRRSPTRSGRSWTAAPCTEKTSTASRALMTSLSGPTTAAETASSAPPVEAGLQGVVSRGHSLAQWSTVISMHQHLTHWTLTLRRLVACSWDESVEDVRPRAAEPGRHSRAHEQLRRGCGVLEEEAPRSCVTVRCALRRALRAKGALRT